MSDSYIYTKAKKRIMKRHGVSEQEAIIYYGVAIRAEIDAIAVNIFACFVAAIIGGVLIITALRLISQLYFK